MYLDEMKLKTIYHIRQAEEISLFDLYKRMFTEKEIAQTSVLHAFAHHLTTLHNNNFIKISIKRDNSMDCSIIRDDVEIEKDMSSIIRLVVRRFSQTSDHSSVYINDSKNIFLSVTEDFEKIRETIGFSISAEMNCLQQQFRISSIFGEKDPSLKSKVFVIMPFSKQMDPIYADHIKDVCDKLKYSCQRADRIDLPNVIINDIWNLICNSDIIICDCTGRNPNVFYELGIAHAVGKKVICITQNSEDIPFDIEQIRYIKYEYNPHGMKEFEEKLMRCITQLD
ncbi:MAG: hypothetical protein E7523_04380 [Ruminococcaceae bacterium]|nr:hypothetical protein [Oscillospiraceae bacterium]